MLVQGLGLGFSLSRYGKETQLHSIWTMVIQLLLDVGGGRGGGEGEGGGRGVLSLFLQGFRASRLWAWGLGVV